jgi:hypothetical protein
MTNKQAPLFYGDDPAGEYEVEVYDHINLHFDGSTFNGQIDAIHPRAREVTVAYDDHQDRYRTTGNPRRKRCRVQVRLVDLVRRDG